MSSLICCARSKTKGDREFRRVLSDGDYLLPGGEWDPSLSVHPTSAEHKGSRFNVRSLLSKRINQGNSAASLDLQGSGEYQPPPLQPSRTLPTMEEFKLLKTVGRGAFGKVMLAVHSETRILYALKVVPKAKITTQKQVNQILAESKILKGIRHPFCIALQYSFQSDDFLFYVFEFAAGGMLFYHLRKEGKFTELRARFYFGEIILALDYLHSFGIVFRDLKPENCMLAEKGHIVLTDFGSAKMLEVSQKTSTIAGTPQYIAPEVLRGEPYSYSADWWSCGILLYEMLTGKIPFSSADRVELYKLVLRGHFTVPRNVSPRAKSLLYKLINQDQNERIGCSCGTCQFHSAADIKQHSFFSQEPMDTEEEGGYAAEDAERDWEHGALGRHRRSRNSSFMDTAGNFLRTVSVSAKRLSVQAPYLGAPCEWTWEELEGRQVEPPFKPKLAGPTDLRHFDPTLTCIPPTLSDLVTTERSLHVENFDYIAPEELPTSKYKVNSSFFDNNMVGTVQVNLVEEGTPSDVNDNSTDEEKISTGCLASEEGGGLKPEGGEGKFVEGKFDDTIIYPPGHREVTVTADINP